MKTYVLELDGQVSSTLLRVSQVLTTLRNGFQGAITGPESAVNSSEDMCLTDRQT